VVALGGSPTGSKPGIQQEATTLPVWLLCFTTRTPILSILFDGVST
jgi:hypothetical protein